MTTKKKVITGAIAACLAGVIAIGATIAYLTDHETVKNTFTFGEVDVVLTETSPEKDGYVQGKEENGGYKYDRVKPGMTYSKDVKVDLAEDSDDAHLFVSITVSNIDNLWSVIQDDKAMLEDLLVNEDNVIKNETNLVGQKYDETNHTFTEVYYLGVKTNQMDEITLFDGVKIPDYFTNANMEILKDGVDVTVQAYAAQAEGLDKKAAFDQFFTGYNYVAE